MRKDEIANILDMLGEYGEYKINIGAEMDRLGISVTKMRRLTGLNHEVVKRYYNGTAMKIDRDVFARITYVIFRHNGNIDNLLEYVPPQKKIDNENR